MQAIYLAKYSRLYTTPSSLNCFLQYLCCSAIQNFRYQAKLLAYSVRALTMLMSSKLYTQTIVLSIRCRKRGTSIIRMDSIYCTPKYEIVGVLLLILDALLLKLSCIQEIQFFHQALSHQHTTFINKYTSKITASVAYYSGIYLFSFHVWKFPLCYWKFLIDPHRCLFVIGSVSM